MSQRHQWLPYLAGLSFSIIFGLSFMFTKEGLTVIQPFHLLAFRFGVAVLFMTLLRMLGLLKMDFRGKNIKVLLFLSLFQPVIYFVCEIIGISKTTASEAGMMIALIPVVVAILSTLFLNEPPTRLQSLFIGASVVGVFFIMYMTGNVAIGDNLEGMFILLGAVLAAGVFNIMSRKLSLHFSSVEITYGMMCMGLISFGGVSLIQHIIAGNLGAFFQPLSHSQALVSIFYLGLVSSVVGFFMMNYMLSKVEASRSAVFANLVTIVSIIAGVAILGDPFYWYHLVGGGLIIIGVWGTNHFRRAM
ncbi:DMT family transporter [Anoxynatronum buryatiense]|uniref:Permease of the drug/metabolite transporter (DMT) superfamily n=1 Tax=Anoxynatronum buryatiense TaxID=489973 RepID=A0AA45WU46_9CLOT|nr:DMT family transporter [Anoxynatronum buryatiense]SMP45872.1 Permease of the drug/metabolite transporter (DMT) superfamily [Anoxynatronum buryatiense]